MKTEEDTRTRPAPSRPRPASLQPFILDPTEIWNRPWEPFGDNDQVRYRSLWMDERSKSYAGQLWMAPGAKVASHAHRIAVHHIWVMEGCCTVEGRHLERGSYVFVPAGTEHRIDWAGPEGCTLFYLYLRADLD